MHPESLDHPESPQLGRWGGDPGGATMGPPGSRQHKEECDEHMVPISPADFFFFSFSCFLFFMIINIYIYISPPLFSAARPGEGGKAAAPAGEDLSGRAKAGSAGARLGFRRRGGREGKAAKPFGVGFFFPF